MLTLLSQVCVYTGCILQWCFNFAVVIGNYSMLYKWSQGSQSGELFSADLGQFRSKSFVMEYGYMFVQVR